MRWFAAAILLLGSALAQAQEANRTALLGVRLLDQRVATIGHKLAVARPDLCPERQWLPGFALHDLSQYSGDYRGTARRLFGLGEGPAVLAVAETGPAKRAGLRADDVLIAIDGRALPPAAPEATHSADRMKTVLGIVEQAFADGAATLEIARDGERRAIAIKADQGCASRFQILPSDEMNASADGIYVEATTAVARYAEDDAELAAVLAHEFAHNILRHRDAINASGRPGGIFARLSGRSRLVRRTEAEADRLSIYLLDAAGYDPAAAIRFWTRFGPDQQPLFRSGSHPDWRRRIAILREEIAALRRQEATGAEAMPSFMKRAE